MSDLDLPGSDAGRSASTADAMDGPAPRTFLLLQARRPGDPAQAHEVESFAEALGVPTACIRPWDLLQGAPTLAALEDGIDCLLVGGSGDFGVGDAVKQPWIGAFIESLGVIADSGFPTFASCFGFQALVVAGGGRVEPDKKRAEVGTFELHVTASGAADPLFGPLAPRFLAQLGHKDHAVEMPASFLHLAGSQRSPYQALALPGKPVYATQFHPELTMRRNRERYTVYLAGYSDPEMPDTPEQVFAAFRETPGATGLLRRFVDLVLPVRR